MSLESTARRVLRFAHITDSTITRIDKSVDNHAGYWRILRSSGKSSMLPPFESVIGQRLSIA